MRRTGARRRTHSSIAVALFGAAVLQVGCDVVDPGERPEPTSDAAGPGSTAGDATQSANDAEAGAHSSDATSVTADSATVDAGGPSDGSVVDGTADGDHGDAAELDGGDALDASTDAAPEIDVGGFDPCAHAKPCVIMPLGDSITYGYGSTIPGSTTTSAGYRIELFTLAVAASQSITFVGSQTTGPPSVAGQPFPPGNEGHSGYSIDDSSKTSGISPLVDHAIATSEPNIVLLMIGTNDMHYGIDLANAPTRLGALLDQITTDAPNALVVVAQIIAANGAQDTPTRAYNASMPGVVAPRIAKGKHLALVDMYSSLGPWSTTLWHDSEHPNNAGYAIMGKTWYAAIQSVLPK